jgi:hypothetical protein
MNRAIALAVVALGLASTAAAEDIACPGHWRQRDHSGPPGRNRHAMAYDVQRKRVVLFGGYQDKTGLRLGDTWEWDGHAWSQRASDGPSPRTHTSLAYDAARNQIVLFGGVGTPGDDYADNDDTWAWDGVAWQRRAEGGPPAARNNQGMAYDSARRRVVMFGGGRTFGRLFTDTWEWNGRRWKEHHPAEHPDGAAVGSAMAFDGQRGQTVMMGGNTCSGPLPTWTWDGSVWSKTTTSSPGVKAEPAMAYDSARHRVVLFGGDDCSGLNQGGDTWEWDGSSWLRVAIDGPGPRGGAAAMAYDRARGEVVFFGGASQNNNDMHDTWAWTGPVYRCETPTDGDLNCDGSIDFDDRKIVRVAIGEAACAADDPRDLDHDGQITTNDTALLTALCTRPDCKRP